MELELELIDQEYIGLKFQFNQQLVSKVKGLANRKWNPREKRWEVHVCHLPDVMRIFYLHPDNVSQEIIQLYQTEWMATDVVIDIGNTFCRLGGASIPVQAIDQVTSFPVLGAEYNERYVSGEWDGRRHLFNKRRMVFPTGILPKVEEALHSENTRYRVRDRRAQTEPTLTFGSARIRLREYQVECVQAAFEAERGILEMASGSGKTAVAAELIRRIQRRAMFFVHTKDLLYQARDHLYSSLRRKIGQIGDGVIDIRPVTVATIQTTVKAFGGKFKSRGEEYEDDLTDISGAVEEIRTAVKSAEVVFFDECHHVPADTCFRVAMNTDLARYRYGLSATPYRADRQDMVIEAALGPKVAVFNASYLIERDYLVPPRVEFIHIPGKNIPEDRGYSDVYQSQIINNRKRNGIIARKAKELCGQGVSVLILVNQIKHGEILNDMIPDSVFVQGSDSAAKRKKALDHLRKKKLLVMIATTLADEGLDVPSLGCVILAGGGKSETKALQRIGRALRPHAGKTEALIFDFFDNAKYLCDHSRRRYEIFQTERLFEIDPGEPNPFDDGKTARRKAKKAKTKPSKTGKAGSKSKTEKAPRKKVKTKTPKTGKVRSKSKTEKAPRKKVKTKPSKVAKSSKPAKKKTEAKSAKTAKTKPPKSKKTASAKTRSAAATTRKTSSKKAPAKTKASRAAAKAKPKKTVRKKAKS